MFGHKFVEVIGKRFRLERIDRLAIHVERKPGVGNARDRQSGIFAQDTDGLAHVLGSYRAVETDNIYAHPFQNGQRGVDIGAEQHAAGRVERDLGLDRQKDLGLVHGFVTADDSSLDFENIL